MQWVECPACLAVCQAPLRESQLMRCESCGAEYQTGPSEKRNPPPLPASPPPTPLQRQQLQRHQQAQYQQPAFQPVIDTQQNPISIVSLVLSCMAMLFVLADAVSTWFPLRVIASPIGGIMGVVILIVSSNELKKIERGEVSSNGKGMVMTGFILGIVSAAIAGILLIWCLTARESFRNNVRRFSNNESRPEVELVVMKRNKWRHYNGFVRISG